ncbi:hypothetical protein GCM10028799_64440 [Kribbella italica]
MKYALKKFVEAGIAALLISAIGVTPSSATTAGWTVYYRSELPYYPRCASGQATYTIYSGPYAGSGKCGTGHTNVYWRNGDVQRQHTFVIAPGGSAWNAVHTMNWRTGVTISASGWKSLGGANLTQGIHIPWAPNPSFVNLVGGTTTGGQFCNQLRNNAWTGWFGC